MKKNSNFKKKWNDSNNGPMIQKGWIVTSTPNHPTQLQCRPGIGPRARLECKMPVKVSPAFFGADTAAQVSLAPPAKKLDTSSLQEKTNVQLWSFG